MLGLPLYCYLCEERVPRASLGLRAAPGASAVCLGTAQGGFSLAKSRFPPRRAPAACLMEACSSTAGVCPENAFPTIFV